MQSVFIYCPWSKFPGNENMITNDQIKKMFYVITKAIMFKETCESLKAQKDNSSVEGYDLNNIGIYNKFINKAGEIIDVEARQYVIRCLQLIRLCNYKKKCAGETIKTLNALICKDEKTRSLYAEFVSENTGKFIDFLSILSRCAKEKFDFSSNEIQEIEKEFTAYKTKAISNIKI